MKKIKIWIGLLIGAILLIIAGQVEGLFLKPYLEPEKAIPNLEIAFQMDDRIGNTIGLIHPDGSGLVTRTVKIPVGSWMKFYTDRVSGPLTWSPDGKNLVMGISTSYKELGFPVIISYDGTINVCSEQDIPSTTNTFWIVQDQKVMMSGPSYPGEIIKNDRVILYDFSTCHESETLFTAAHSEGIGEAHLSASGWLAITLLPIGRDDDRIEIYNPNYELIHTFPGAGSLSWSRDGEWLAYTHFEGSASYLYIVRKNGTNLHKFGTAHDSPSWSPDGKWIVFERNARIFKVNIETGEETFLVAGYHPNWRWAIPLPSPIIDVTPTPIRYAAFDKTSETCRIPCWNGFTPGKSTLEEFRTWVNTQNDFRVLVPSAPGDPTIQIIKYGLETKGNNDEVGKSSSASFVFVEQALNKIGVEFSVRPTLQNITDTYGFPEYSSNIGREQTNDRGYLIILFYPSKGIYFEAWPDLSDFGTIQPDMKVKTMELCRPGTLEEMVVRLNGFSLKGPAAEKFANEWIQSNSVRPGWMSYGPVEVMDPHP